MASEQVGGRARVGYPNSKEGKKERRGTEAEFAKFRVKCASVERAAYLNAGKM